MAGALSGFQRGGAGDAEGALYVSALNCFAQVRARFLQRSAPHKNQAKSGTPARVAAAARCASSVASCALERAANSR